MNNSFLDLKRSVVTCETVKLVLAYALVLFFKDTVLLNSVVIG